MRKALALIVAPFIALALACLVPTQKASAQWATCGTGGRICTNSEADISSGRPWCDPRSPNMGGGAKGDGVTNDTAAFQACVTKLQAQGGGILKISPGTYCITTAGGIVAHQSSSIRFVGDGVYATFLSFCGVDTTIIDLDGPYSSIENLSVFGKGMPGDASAVGATQPAIRLGVCGTCLISYVNVFGGAQGIKLDGTIESRLENVATGFGHVKANIYGVSGSTLKAHRTSTDQAWPVSVPPKGISPGARANATLYATGAVVLSGGYYLQALTGGTSGGAPPTLKNYGINITDGTVVWRLVAPQIFYGMQLDTGWVEAFLETMDFTGAYRAGLALTNTLGGTPPALIFIGKSVFSITQLGAVEATDGNSVHVTNSEVFSCIFNGCSMFSFSTNFTGNASIVNNEIRDASASGVAIASGNKYIISDNNLGGSGAGVSIAAGITDFGIVGNTFLDVSPVVVGAGASDRYAIIGNNLQGAVVSDGGTGVNKTVAFNDGSALKVPNGGTGLTSGTSGGVPYFNSTSTMASSAALTANRIMLGGGAGAAPTVLGSLGTTTTVLHGNAAGAPSYGPIVAGDVTANTLTNATLAQMGASTVKGRALGAGTGDPQDLTLAQLYAMLKPTIIETDPVTVNFGSANTDFALTLPTLPTGYTRWKLSTVQITGASANISAATFGVFSTTGGGGLTLLTSGTACTVTATTDDTAGNSQQAGGITTVSITPGGTPSPQFRVQTAAASGTAKVTATWVPLQ